MRWHLGQYEKIKMVTMEEFEKAQLILQSNGYKHQQLKDPVGIDAILNEILICGKCFTEIQGQKRPTKMVFESKTRYTCVYCHHRYSSAEKKACPQCSTPIMEKTKKEVHRYYRCGKRSSSEACAHDFYKEGKPTKNLRAEDIEQYLDDSLSMLHISDELFHVLKRQLYTLWIEKNDTLRKQKEALRKELKKLEDERVKINRQGLDKEQMSEVEREDHALLMDDNQRKQEDLEEKIGDLKEAQEEQIERAWQGLNALRDASMTLKGPDTAPEPKKKLILSLVSNLKITDEHWEIIWKSPFDVVAKSAFAKKGRPASGASTKGANYNWLPALRAFRTTSDLPCFKNF